MLSWPNSISSMDLKYKKILVTGGAGFLGQHIVSKLKNKGVQKEDILIPRSQDLDLRVKENCEKVVKGINVIIHAAGATGGVDFHKRNPAIAFYDNLIMGVELMEAARKEAVEKFVTIGSAASYPDNAPLPYKEEDLWIGPPEETHAPYTVAKKMLLVQGQAYRRQYGLNVIHLLMTNMYGPLEPISYVIPMLIDKITKAKTSGGRVEVWGTGRPTRDFLFVEDAADGIILATEKYDKPEPVNLASGKEISISDLVNIVCRHMNFDGEVFWDTSKPDGQSRRLLDTSRAEKEFGFKASTDFSEGCEKTIRYHSSPKIHSLSKNGY